MENEQGSAPISHVRVDYRPVTGDVGFAVVFCLVFTPARVLEAHAAA